MSPSLIRRDPDEVNRGKGVTKEEEGKDGKEGEEEEESSTGSVSLRTLVRDALLRASDGSNEDDEHVCSNASPPPMLHTMSTKTERSESGDISVAGSLDSTDDRNYEGLRSKLLTADVLGEDVCLTPLERNLIYTRIYGRQPPEVEWMEERMHQLERAIWRLPKEEKAALLRVLRKNPLLFAVSSQTKICLCAIDFDAHRAARRLAHYWTKREQLLGEDGAFREGDMPAAGREDYSKFYARSEAVVDDPDADDVERDIAQEFIRCVNRNFVAQVDHCVTEVLRNNSKELLIWLEECNLVKNALSPSLTIGGSDELKMLFVRCQGFNEVQAAGQLLQYWSKKCMLFDSNFENDVATHKDLWECQEVLELGFIRIMPGTDKYGRVVIVFTMKILAEVLDDLSDEDGEEKIMKVIWYVLSAALERKNCQRNGIIFLANLREGSTDLLRRFKLRAACRDILLRCMPIQVKAFHFFFPPSQTWWQSVIYSIFKHSEPLYKKHAVIHAGASEEVELSSLAECGIFPPELPEELGGEVPLEYYRKWLEDRKSKGL